MWIICQFFIYNIMLFCLCILFIGVKAAPFHQLEFLLQVKLLGDFWFCLSSTVVHWSEKAACHSSCVCSQPGEWTDADTVLCPKWHPVPYTVHYFRPGPIWTQSMVALVPFLSLDPPPKHVYQSVCSVMPLLVMPNMTTSWHDSTNRSGTRLPSLRLVCW